jgi:integrating conjugative element protein (TIGR03755 family)
MPVLNAFRQTTTALASPVLPWLLVLALALGPALGPLPSGALDLVPAARAQSRIDELKGALGQGVRSDDVPAGRTGWAFGIGAGADTDGLRPPTFSQKLQIGANFSAGFGYSCGQFDPFDSVEQMIESAIEKFKQLPQMFVQAAQAAVAGLPAYILNKINPSLYNVVTKQIDEAFKLFEINFKDCQTIEREIALGQNPYQSLVMAGIGDRMRVEMGFGSGTIDDRMRQVRTQGPSNGIVMSEGKRYGGEGQPPIEAIENVLLAGINLLTDRSAGDTSSFGSGAHEKHPITQQFASPEKLVEFVTDIYGSQAYVLTKEGPAQSKPGTGYQKKYVELRDDTIEQLQKYVKREIERREFEDKTGLLIPPATVDEMRDLPPYSLSIAIDDQARLHAVERLKLKLDYALQSLKTGLKEPNLAQSEAYEVIERETTKLAIAIQDDLAHINHAVYLR